MPGRIQRALGAFLHALHEPATPTRRSSGPLEPLIPLDEIAPADEPAEFLGAEATDLVPGYAFLYWNTHVGVLAAAYRTTERVRIGKPAHIRHHRTDIRVQLTVPDMGFWAPDGPDVQDEASGQSLWWRYYANAIGRAAPYWPWSLAHRELIAQWRPGDPVVTTAATHDTEAVRLLELAALYPPDSTVARVLRHCYLRSAQAANAGHRVCFESFAEEPQDEHTWRLTGYLEPAAAAIPLDELDQHAQDEFSDTALRSVFADITSRTDTLSEQVVDELRGSGVRSFLPFNHTERYHLPSRADRPTAEHSATFQEWRHRLQEAPPRQPDARFGGLPRDEASCRFVDPITGAPVVCLDHEHVALGTEYVTLLPRRLPTTSPLAEVILDGGQHVWVRTSDRVLYPLPAGDLGYAWGYGGTGPGTLTRIVERLLDDITAAPVDAHDQPPTASLERVFQRKHPTGTVLTRAELEHARSNAA